MEHPAELIKAFSNLSPTSDNYCSICLRTSEERRLVKPQAFKKFVKDLYIDYSIGPRSLICFICEKQALSAYKFYEAASFAISIKQVLKDYMKAPRPEDEAAVKKKLITILTKKASLYSSMKNLEVDLKMVRARTQMLNTEVLVIDSNGMHQKPPGESPDDYIVPDDPDIEHISNMTHTSISPTETVILIDEDDDTETCKTATQGGPKLIPIERLLGPPTSAFDPQIVEPTFNNTKKDTEKVVITKHRLQHGIEGKTSISPEKSLNNMPGITLTPASLYLPTISTDVLNACIIIPDNNNLVQTQNICAVQVSTANDFNIPNKAQNTNVIKMNGVASAQLVAIQPNTNLPIYKVTSEPPKILPKPQVSKEKTLRDLLTPLAKEIKTKTLEVIRWNDVNRTIDIGDNARDNLSATLLQNSAGAGGKRAGEAPVINDVTSVSDLKKRKGEQKLPVQKGDRIDWEDKIPMDVISFMDAVDPNAHPIFSHPNSPAQPNYEISHVRSLSEPDTTTKQLSNNVIDLC